MSAWHIADPINNAEKTCQTILNISCGLLCPCQTFVSIIIGSAQLKPTQIDSKKTKWTHRYIYKFITPSLSYMRQFFSIVFIEQLVNTHIHTHTLTNIIYSNLWTLEPKQFQIVKVNEAIKLWAPAACLLSLIHSHHHEKAGCKWNCKTKQECQRVQKK